MMKSNSDPVLKIECMVDNDPRLLAGAAAIACHVARGAGFSAHAAEEFAGAASEACAAIFSARGESDALPSEAKLRLTAAEWNDRTEITIEEVAQRTGAFRSRSGPGASEAIERNLRRKLEEAELDRMVIEFGQDTRQVILVKCCGVANRRPRF